MRNITLLLTALCLAVLALSGCSTSDGDTPDATTTTEAGGVGDAEISVLNFRFEPADVSISVGESVTWTNDSSATHTSTAVDGSWDVTLAGGQNLTQSFDTAGTFEFFCSIHPAMTGTVTVNG